MTPSVLVVEDEPAILELLRVNLVDAGYEVRAAADAETAQQQLNDALPSLMLLDWMLPGKSGLALAKELRSDTRTRDLPIIMLTARTDEADKVAGLEAWVDDYVTKPFSPRELKARIKTVLRRRAPEAAQEPLTAGSLRLDPVTHRVTSNDADVALGPTEFRLLRFLLARPERVHSRAQLLDQVWGDHVYIEERTVDVHIRRLRLALAPFGHDALVETVRGSGYRLSVPKGAWQWLGGPSPHAMKPVIVSGVAAPLVILGLAALAGLTIGAVWAAGILAVGLVGWTGFNLWHVARLTRWAESPPETPVPEARGAWGVAFSALYRRVRSRVRHQRDLARTIERFREAVDALPDGMVILDAGNRIQWANARAQSYLGFDLAKDEGRPLLNFMRQPEVVRYLEAGEYTDALIIDSLREAGTTLSIQVVPYGDEARLLISRNITQIESVARMRRDFIANVSHELKTPLTVVTGFLETMQDLDLEPRQRTRYLQLMAEQAKSMQRLVDDLLTLSSLESEKNVLSEAAFDIVPLLLEISADAKALSGGRHTVALDIREPAIVVGNRDELKSAFGNLVSNAVRYTPEGGTITLGWHVDEEGRGAFSVTDTGIGIAPEHIPRLTERFYRVDRSRSRATGGTGLGLAIVKHVLWRHQAELDVMSELGTGSTFAVQLPAKRIERVGGGDAVTPVPAAREAPTNT